MRQKGRDMPYDINHERLMDIVFILIIVGAYVLVYVYGKYQYQKGLQDGLREGRKVRREIRRGNIYRLKQ